MASEEPERRPVPQQYDYPDRFLPLYHMAVVRATGVSAKTLKKALLSCPEQFAADAYQIIRTGDGEHLRFNPARHLRARKERSTWPEKAVDGNFTEEETPSGSGGPTAAEEKCASGSLTIRESPSPKTHRPEKPIAPPQMPTTTGAEWLMERLRERKKR